MAINTYNYNDREITAIIIDETNEFMWVAFDLQDGYCNLKKLSVNDPTQIYYSIDIAVTQITKLFIYGSYLYVAVEDTSLIGIKYSLTNPLTSYTLLSIPAGVTQIPIDIIVDGTNIYYLLEGNLSGTNSQIVKTGLTGTLVEIIDLATVTNTKSFTLASSGDFWLATYENPSVLVRVYYATGAYHYSTF